MIKNQLIVSQYSVQVKPGSIGHFQLAWVTENLTRMQRVGNVSEIHRKKNKSKIDLNTMILLIRNLEEFPADFSIRIQKGLCIYLCPCVHVISVYLETAPRGLRSSRESENDGGMRILQGWDFWDRRVRGTSRSANRIVALFVDAAAFELAVCEGHKPLLAFSLDHFLYSSFHLFSLFLAAVPPFSFFHSASFKSHSCLVKGLGAGPKL